MIWEMQWPLLFFLFFFEEPNRWMDCTWPGPSTLLYSTLLVRYASSVAIFNRQEIQFESMEMVGNIAIYEYIYDEFGMESLQMNWFKKFWPPDKHKHQQNIHLRSHSDKYVIIIIIWRWNVSCQLLEPGQVEVFHLWIMWLVMLMMMPNDVYNKRIAC